MDAQRRKEIHNATTVSVTLEYIEKLNKIHSKFIEHVASWKDKEVNGGSFRTEGENFSATAIGVRFKVVRRLVGNDWMIAASEYAFITEHNGEDLCLLCIYLDHIGNLFTDPAMTNGLCDFDNPYVPSKIVDLLARAVLKSPVIAPRTVFAPAAAVISTK